MLKIIVRLEPCKKCSKNELQCQKPLKIAIFIEIIDTMCLLINICRCLQASSKRLLILKGGYFAGPKLI